MQYVTYCRTCNAITGHQTQFLKSECLKCHTQKRTPIIRWVALIGFILISAIVAFWFSITMLYAMMGW